MKRSFFTKCLCLVLSLAMALSLAAPAFAAQPTLTGSQVPVVLLGGDGTPLYDKDGNLVFDINNWNVVFSGSDNSSVLDAAVNVLQPFLLEGILQNKWDRYYENLEKEVGEIFEKVRLDENGNCVNGVNIGQKLIDQVNNDMRTDKRGAKGYYALNDYRFWYDWRLDPVELADQLHDYIEAVKSVTGAEKVSLISRCVGTNVVLAYIAKYGTDSLHGVGFNGSSSYGGEFIDEALSGKFHVDGEALERVLIDYQGYEGTQIPDFLIATIDLLNKSGVLDHMTAAARIAIYAKIAQGVTSALALSTLFTFPCYWGFVTAENYETAKQYVFGEESSEKRVKYAGLIEKLDRFHALVRTQLMPLVKRIKDDGKNLSIISKYGYQMLPICESADAVSDEYASFYRSSLGATTSTVYDTLSDEYIAARVAEGKGKYISPDRQVDASTCLFPDYTWFVKGSRHGHWTDYENSILYAAVTADRQLTVDDFYLTQFFVYSEETDEAAPMTEENCHTEKWTAEKPANFIRRFIAFVKSWFNWLKQLFRFVSDQAEQRKG